MAIRTALVVDDSRLARLTLTKLLEKRDIQVSQASSALEAFESLKGSRPDVIMMDVTMPETDGYEATRQIVGDPVTSAIPVVMCTAEDSDEARDRAEACGAHGFLTKPASEENITDVLQRLAEELDASEPDLVVQASSARESAGGHFGLDVSMLDARARAIAETVLREQGREMLGGVMESVARTVFESMSPANEAQAVAELPPDFGDHVRAAAVDAATVVAREEAQRVARSEADTVARAVATESGRLDDSAQVAEESVHRMAAELRQEFDTRLQTLLTGDELSSRVREIARESVQESARQTEDVAVVARREATEVASEAARREAEEAVARAQASTDTTGHDSLRTEAKKALALAKKLFAFSVVVLGAAVAAALLL